MRWWVWVLGALALVAVGVAVLPMRWVTERYVPDLEADAVTGSVWDARFTNARFQGMALGDIETGLSFRDLVTGEASVRFRKVSEPIEGQFFATRTVRGVRGLNGQTAVPVLPAPWPKVTLAVADGQVTLTPGGECRTASGKVSASIADLPVVGSLPLLEGVAQCDGPDLLLPMAARGGPGRLRLRVQPGGRWSAELGLVSESAFGIAALAAAGFRPVASEMVRTVAGGG